MSYESYVLLTNQATESNGSVFSYTEKQPGAGYHQKSDSNHTVQYSVNAFNGTIKMQGTLELYPVETDWFDINGTEMGGDSATIATAIKTYNFVGNFAWVRAAYNIQNGTITEIRFNH